MSASSRSFLSQATLLSRDLFWVIFALPCTWAPWCLRFKFYLKIMIHYFYLHFSLDVQPRKLTLMLIPLSKAEGKNQWNILFFLLPRKLHMDSPLLLTFMSGQLANLVTFCLLNPHTVCFFSAATTTYSIQLPCPVVKTAFSYFILPRTLPSRLVFSSLPRYLFFSLFNKKNMSSFKMPQCTAIEQRTHFCFSCKRGKSLVGISKPLF